MAAPAHSAVRGTTLVGSALASRYEGDYGADARRHGTGRYVYPNAFFKYDGEWAHGLKHGRGRFELGDGTVYEGDMFEGEITGRGRKTWADGRTYEGDFVEGEMHGEGTHVSADGAEKYSGGFFRNRRSGRGTLSARHGDVYEGAFEEGLPHGEGKLTFGADGSGGVYTGAFQCGVRSGQGRMETPSGDAYEGEWDADAPHGCGTRTSGDSGLTHEGDFVRGHFEAVPDRFALALSPAAGDGDQADANSEGAGAPTLSVVAGEMLEPTSAIVIECLLPSAQPAAQTNGADAGTDGGAAAQDDEGDDEAGPAEPSQPEVAVGESGRRVCMLLVPSPPAVGAEEEWLESLVEVEVESESAEAGDTSDGNADDDAGDEQAPAPPRAVALGEFRTELGSVRIGALGPVPAGQPEGEYALVARDATPGVAAARLAPLLARRVAVAPAPRPDPASPVRTP